MMILSALVLAGEADDGVPPSRPVPVSISDLARRFKVSRVHVKTMLQDAAAAGLIERTGQTGDKISFTPMLAEALNTFCANAFLFFHDCASEAAAAVAAKRRAWRRAHGVAGRQCQRAVSGFA